MEEIWVNRILAGDKTLEQVPEFRREAVAKKLEERKNFVKN